MTTTAQGLRAWGTVLLALALVVGLVAVAGGWREASSQATAVRAVGEPVRVAQWRLVVTGAALVNYEHGSDYPGPDNELRLLLELTNTTGETLENVPTGLVEVLAADGTLLEARSYLRRTPPWGVGWDPGVPAESMVDVALPQVVGDAPGPGTVHVVVHDQVPARGFLTSPGELAVGAARWRYEVPVADQRLPVVR